MESPSHASGVIDTVTHPLALRIRDLLSRAGRAAADDILIDDEENIRQAVRSGVRLASLYYAGDSVIPPDLVAAAGRGVPVHEIAKRTCKKLFETERMSRVFAIAPRPAQPSLADVAATARDIVVLDDLTLSGNIGAIVRTSAALGVGGIVVLDRDPVDVFDRR